MSVCFKINNFLYNFYEKTLKECLDFFGIEEEKPINSIKTINLEEVIVTEPINSVKKRINLKREIKNSDGDDILWDILTVDELI